MLNLGSILFGLGADTSGLAKARAAIDAFGTNAAAAFAKAKKGLDDMNKAANDQQVIHLMRGFTEASALTLGPLDGLTYRLRAATVIMGQFGLAAGLGVGVFGGVTLGVVALSEALIKNIIAVQQSEMTLKGITGSATIAGGEISYLRDVANQAGFAFTDLAPNFARFVASATGAGQSLEVTNKEFKELALLTGTLHLSSQEMNNVMMAFDHMLSMGRVQGQQLRQLFNNMPAVFTVAAQAAKEMGIDLQSAMKKGSVAAGEFLQHFLADADKLFNIDLTKPIKSLQASLGLLKGSWQELVVTFAQALDAGGAYQSLFTSLANGMTFLSQHITVVINVLGAFLGALAGVAAVFAMGAAIQGLMAVIGALSSVVLIARAAWTVFFGTLSAGTPMLFTATVATEELAAAQSFLDAALAANPFGIIITVVGLLAGAYLGLKVGADAAASAQQNVNHQMADTTGIDAYIEQCKQAKTQTASLTAELIKNTQAKLTQNVAYMQDTANQLKTAQKALADMQYNKDHEGLAKGLGADDTGLALMAGQADKAKKSVDDLTAKLVQQTSDVRNLTTALKGLTEISKLPSGTQVAQGHPQIPNKDAERGLRSIDDIITKAKDAQKALDDMWKGPANDGLLKSLEEAQKRLFDLKPDQLAEITALLNNAGFSVEAAGGLLPALTMVIEKTRIATDTVKEFEQVWNDIHKEAGKAQSIKAQFDFLDKGGDPYDMYGIQALKLANDELLKLKATAADAGQLRETLQALENPKTGKPLFNTKDIEQLLEVFKTSRDAGLDAINVALEKMGYDGETAQESLQELFKTVLEGDKQLKDFIKTAQQIEEFKNGLADFNEQLQIMRKGGSLSDIQMVGFQRQAKDLLEGVDQAHLDGLQQRLAAIGIQGNSATDSLAEFLRQEGYLKEQSDLVVKALDNQVNAWVNLGTSSVDTIEKILTGATTLKEGLRSIIGQIGQTILNAAFFDPLKLHLTTAIQGLAGGRSGLAGDPLNAGAAANAVQLLAKSAGSAGQTLGVDFVSSLLKGTVGSTSEAGARTANIAVINTSTVALGAFASALTLATAAAGAGSMDSLFSTIATASFALKDGGMIGFPHFDSGGVNGLIRGAGGPRDDKNLAWLSNGEFVVNAAATKQWLWLLKMINGNGQGTTGYADGGYVGSSGTGALNSLLIGQRGSTIIDASSTFHINGNVDQSTFDQMKDYADQREAQLRDELPLLIDSRVIDSNYRGRYSG